MLLPFKFIIFEREFLLDLKPGSASYNTRRLNFNNCAKMSFSIIKLKGSWVKDLTKRSVVGIFIKIDILLFLMIFVKFVDFGEKQIFVTVICGFLEFWETDKLVVHQNNKTL